MIRKVVLGDVLEKIDEIENNSIDLVFADPKFNRGREDAYEEQVNDSMEREAYFSWCETWIKKSFEKIKPTGNVCVMNTWENIGHLQCIMEKYGVFKNIVTWNKKITSPQAKGRFMNVTRPILMFSKTGDNYPHRKIRIADLISVSKHPGGYLTPVEVLLNEDGTFFHKLQLPESLLKFFIIELCPEGGIVLDLFSGTGTTSAVAKKYRRGYIAIEIVKKYYDAITTRLEKTRAVKPVTSWF